MVIGKIVSASAHYDYVCQVYLPGEVANPPSREAYQLGTFSRIDLENNTCLITLIYNTQLFNPEFGRLGPRLSPEAELVIFTPDYLQEKVTLLGLIAIGLIRANGSVQQGLPLPAASSDALVTTLDDKAVRAFHKTKDGLHLDYLPFLLSLSTPLTLPLCQNVIQRLRRLFPKQLALLQVIEQQLARQSQIRPFGD